MNRRWMDPPTPALLALRERSRIRREKLWVARKNKLLAWREKDKNAKPLPRFLEFTSDGEGLL